MMGPDLGYDGVMTKKLIFFLLILVAVVPLGAQTSNGRYDLAWFDHRDDVSGTTGLGTLIRLDPGITSHPFSLTDRASFDPKSYDMIVFGSFSERHPSWDDFVRSRKSEILEWVRSGGILVQMCRSRKSDRSEGLKLNLLPSGFEVFRGSEDNDEFHASDDLLPLWRGIHDSYKKEGNGANNPSWYRRPGGAFGKIEHGPMDAFERWSSQFTKSAGVDMDKDRGEAFALHASYGSGQILLFQLTFDKYDGAENLLSQTLAKKFFDCLSRYGKQRPNPGKAKPIPVVIVPDPPIATKLTIDGRAFIDDDRDGRYDRNERALPGLRIRDLDQEVVTDKSGRFRLERPIEASGFLSVQGLPDKLSLPGGWFELVEKSSRSTLNRDFAFQERRDDRQRLVVASLPAGLDKAGVLASVESRLILAAKKEAAGRLVLFAGPATSAELKKLASRLEPLFVGDPGFELFLALPPELDEKDAFSPRDWSFDLGPWRFSTDSAPQTPGDDRVLVAMAFGNRDLGSERKLVLLPEPRAQGERSEFQYFAPNLLDPEALAAESAYLVFEAGPDGNSIRLVPEVAAAESDQPRLPVHRWGVGKIADLLKQAREEAKN